MKTRVELQKEYDQLKKQLKDFEQNLPSDFTLVRGKIVENEKVIVASFYAREREYMANEMKDFQIETNAKMIKAKVASNKEFLQDFAVLTAKFNEGEMLPKEEFISAEFKKVFKEMSKEKMTPADLFYELFCDFLKCEFKGYDAAKNIMFDPQTDEPVEISSYLKENTSERLELERSYEVGVDSFEYKVILETMGLGNFEKKKTSFNKEKKEVE